MDDGDMISSTPSHGPAREGQTVVSGVFADAWSAQAAIVELLDVGIPAEDISLLSRDEGFLAEPELAGASGGAGEEIGDEARTYRASTELPNDEDRPISEAGMAGEQLPVITDY